MHGLKDIKLILVITTEANFAKAELIANKLLNLKLAACVSFKEIKSYYWWDNQIENSNEVQLLIKTNRDKLEAVVKIIKVFHSYKIPELIFLEAVSEKNYLNWVHDVIQ